MNEEKIRKFLERIRNAEEALKEYREFMALKNRFTAELIDQIGSVTYDHFSPKVPPSDLVIEGALTERELREKITLDKDFQFYGIWIVEGLNDHIINFSDDEIPAGRKLYYKKIEYPSFTDEEIEKEIEEFEKDFCFDSNQREELFRMLKDDAKITRFYITFQIRIHKALKKLALEYFPKITEISSVGIREIDYMLHTYMFMINENIMKILENTVQVSVKNPVLISSTN